MRTSKLSRRALISGFAAAPLISNTATANSPDAKLIELGHQFDAVTSEIDVAFQKIISPAQGDEIFARLSQVEVAILTTPATTIEGLSVKAKIACWARLGDLDPVAGTTMDTRAALSIVRDLIRLFEPYRERPHALRDLIAEKPRSDFRY